MEIEILWLVEASRAYSSNPDDFEFIKRYASQQSKFRIPSEEVTWKLDMVSELVRLDDPLCNTELVFNQKTTNTVVTAEIDEKIDGMDTCER